MHVLVTGGSGFLARKIVARLFEQGRQVTVTSRDPRALERSIKGARVVPALPELDHLMSVDVIIHAAAAYLDQEGSSLEEANVTIPLEIVRRARAASVSGIVYVNTALAPNVSRYAETKHRFADRAALLAREGGPTFIDLRVQLFYGPGGAPDRFIHAVARACLAQTPRLPLTEGLQRRDFVFADDVAGAMVRATSIAVDEPRVVLDVGTGVSVRVRDVVTQLHALAKSSTVLGFGDLPLRSHEPMDCVADPRPFAKLGWAAQTPLDAGLSETVAYWRQVAAEA